MEDGGWRTHHARTAAHATPAVAGGCHASRPTTTTSLVHVLMLMHRARARAPLRPRVPALGRRAHCIAMRPALIIMVVAAIKAVTLPAAAGSAPSPTTSSEVCRKQFEFCIVGEGPGGLQLGHLMMLEGWEFIILERNAGPASFFEKFPIHRQLISLNKRFTGRADAEFNLRHDWNSLLGNPGVRPVTNRSTLRFPSADVVVEYMRDFSQAQEAAGRIAYNTTVRKVGRDADGMWVSTSTAGGSEDGGALHCPKMRCTAVVMANGIGVPNLPAKLEKNGWGAAKTYAEMPSSSADTGYREYEQYENHTALVVGMGNAAFETMDALSPHAAYVHVLPGRAGNIKIPLYAHETRYVGDLRLMRASTIDAYLLKSLDGGFNGECSNRTFSTIKHALDDVS
eukprot:COSAG01_NODE_11082_length_2011_cov_1.506276_1_plen_397_part_00